MAVAEGLNYEERVAAWAYSQLLAAGSSRRLGTQDDWRITAVWMQAPVPVGDVLVEHSGNGAVFIQAKFRKSPFRFDARADGEFSEVFLSFARQYFSANSGGDDAPNPWSRRFDPKRDVMALVLPSSAGETSIRTIATILEKALDANVWLNPQQSLNKNELAKFTMICEVAKKAIADSSTTAPTNDVVRLFLSAVRVLILDVDDNDPGAAEAQLVLRESVLPAAASSQVIDVWKELIGCARTANRSGLRFDLFGLSELLLKEGVSLRTPPAFREDIQKLKDVTKRNLVRMKQLAELRIASIPVEIPRECVTALLTAIDTNRVLIGDPGAGKSGVMYQLCNKLLADQKDVVLLLADDLETESSRPLHDALGIKNDLFDVLSAWTSAANGFLVIDALDAARDPKLARRIRNTMSDIVRGKSRWRIIASVRRFDLKHSPDTQVLFPGQPASGFADPDFNGISHFNVPLLNDAELTIAGQSHPSIAALLQAANIDSTTKRLLTQPFNLSLACELIRSGVAIDKIVPLTTKSALLDKFWNYRVESGGPIGAQRESALHTLATHLVSNLSMGLQRHAATFDPAILYDLAEQHILEPGAYADGVLRFAHHLLHDYAVARLLFRPLSPKQLVDRISNNPELSIYARQSLLLHFDYLWDTDPSRKNFWMASIELVRSSLPLIARILATECAVARIREWSDFMPLLDVRQGEQMHGASAILIQYVVSELLDVNENERLIKCSSAWAKLAVELMKQFPDHNWQVHLLLYKLSDLKGLDTNCRTFINQAGRLLAENRMSQPRESERFGPAFITGIKAICRTADMCPAESENALRPILTSQFAATFGDKVYWQLAEEIKHLLRISPILVRDLYIAVFSNETAAEGWENIGGKIMPMRIQRRDNYSMAENLLKERFPDFFASSPIEATRAVVRFFPGFRIANHPKSSGEPDQRQEFTFLGRTCHLIADYSCIWASDAPHHGDDALVILRHARDGWVKLADKSDIIDEIINIIIEENELAVIWWTLLEAGVEAKHSIGLKLIGLLTERSILMGMDTHHSAAKLLGVIFPDLDRERRSFIERFIVSLPKEVLQKGESDEHSEDLWRGLYMGVLKPEHLVTDEAKALMDVLTAEKQLRANPPPFTTHASFGGTTDWSDYVPGVSKEDLKTATHRKAHDWEKLLQQHKDRDKSKTAPNTTDELWSVLNGAYEFAVKSPPVDLSPQISDLVWSQVVSVAEKVVTSGPLPIQEDRIRFLKEVLLRAATDSNPATTPEIESHFAEFPSWGSPCPRVDAAQALVSWGREFKSLDDDIRHALRNLAIDAHPAVRFQILGSCNALYEIDHNLMWELIETGVQRETNVGVWGGLLVAVDRFSAAHPDKVAALISKFLIRFPNPIKSNRDPKDTAVGILGGIFLRSGHEQSSRYIYDLIEHPVRNSHLLCVLAQNFRHALSVGLGETATEFHKRIHTRALDFNLRVVDSAKTTLNDLMVKLGTQKKEERESIINDARSILQLLDAVNLQVFFASGAHDAQKIQSTNVATPLLVAFWKDTAPIIRMLTSIENAHIAYHLAETLEYLLPADPEKIFCQLVILVRSANKDGFANESLAVGVITRIIERYLADYSDLFTDQAHCREGLIEVLDAFAAVGWPEARRLIRNLSRIYR